MKYPDLAQHTYSFRQQMRDGLAGRESSLAMLQSYLKPAYEWPRGASVVAMDMGGTNFRIARVGFTKGGDAEIQDYSKMSMPGTAASGATTIEGFFSFFAEKISAFNEEKVGLCFSYPAEILPDRDGRIITFSKGVQVAGAEGRKLGEGCNAALSAMGSRPRSFAVLNDTVAAMLGTKSANIGLILGTGLNICYDDHGSIINTEAGRYTGFPSESWDVGPLAEMKVSGAYILDLIRNNPDCEDFIYERAARMVSIELVSIIAEAGLEEGRIAAEGSAFWNNAVLQRKIRACMDEYTERMGLKYCFLDGRDKTLIGTAVAALSE